jgi:hypothetical protein
MVNSCGAFSKPCSKSLEKNSRILFDSQKYSGWTDVEFFSWAWLRSKMLLWSPKLSTYVTYVLVVMAFLTDITDKSNFLKEETKANFKWRVL